MLTAQSTPVFEQLSQGQMLQLAAPQTFPECFLGAGRVTCPASRSHGFGRRPQLCVWGSSLTSMHGIVDTVDDRKNFCCSSMCVSDTELPSHSSSLNQGPTLIFIYVQKQTGNRLSKLCVVLIVDTAVYSSCNYGIQHSKHI